MSGKELYKRFTSLCQKWPKDETKAGRDYGEYFRAQMTSYFPHGEISHVADAKKVDRELSALERIANDQYFNENPLKRSSASGLEAWACKEAISNEGIRQLEEQDEITILNRLKKSLGVRFSASPGSEHKFLEEVDLKEEDKVANKK